MDRNQLTNDTEVAIRYGLDGRQAVMWTALPAIVTSVSFSAMTLECQPTIQGMVTASDGSQSPVNLPMLVDVPIVFPSAGGFTLTFPIKIGDEVLVIFASRCIDAWWQQGGIQPPMELRMHDLSDGFAIPGPKSQPKVIGSISSSNAQLRTNDGVCYLEITPSGGINLKAPSGVSITGALNVTGTIIATGEITSGIIPLSTHLHPGVTPGAGDTGAPIP